MSVTAVNSGAIVAQGTLRAADDAVMVMLNNCDWVAGQVLGTFSATVSFEATVDNLTWVALGMGTLADQATVATSTTGAGAWAVECGGLYAVRFRCSSFSSGAMQVSLNVGR